MRPSHLIELANSLFLRRCPFPSRNGTASRPPVPCARRGEKETRSVGERGVRISVALDRSRPRCFRRIGGGRGSEVTAHPPAIAPVQQRQPAARPPPSPITAPHRSGEGFASWAWNIPCGGREGVRTSRRGRPTRQIFCFLVMAARPGPPRYVRAHACHHIGHAVPAEMRPALLSRREASSSTRNNLTRSTQLGGSSLPCPPPDYN